jgi:hypothetical protein
MKDIKPEPGALQENHIYHIRFLHSETAAEILIKIFRNLHPADGLVWFDLLATTNSEGERRFRLGYTSARNFCCGHEHFPEQACRIQEPDPEDLPLYIGWYFVSQELTDRIRRAADEHPNT